MKAPKLSTTKNMVLEELQLNPKLRDDDFLLICAIFERYVDIDNLSFREVMEQHNRFGLPACETIRRSRTIIQAKYPELGASEFVKEARNKNQANYIERNRVERDTKRFEPTKERPTESGLWGQSILDEITAKVESKNRPTIG